MGSALVIGPLERSSGTGIRSRFCAMCILEHFNRNLWSKVQQYKKSIKVKYCTFRVLFYREIRIRLIQYIKVSTSIPAVQKNHCRVRWADFQIEN